MSRLIAGFSMGAMLLLTGVGLQQFAVPVTLGQAPSQILTPDSVFMPHIEQNALVTIAPTATDGPPLPPTGSPRATYTATETPTPSETLTMTATATPTGTLTATETPTGTLTPTATPSPPLEDFEGPIAQWLVQQQAAGGSIAPSTTHAASGALAARASTSSSGATAYLYTTYSDPASARTWGERPGVWRWQRARIYLPASTVAQLGANDALTLAGLWPSAQSGTHGWWLQVRRDGALYVRGYDADGVQRVFNVYGAFPLDQWVDLEVGLHSQSGPGVKRAFAFLVNGSYYGWYHQGHLTTETYDRAAFGILATTTANPLQVYVDDWQAMTTAPLPGGPDSRPTTTVQEIDYTQRSGNRWQIDWSTWGNDLRMDAQEGLYSANIRLQSGMNLDRMPELTTGWAEIEIGWPQGTPNKSPTSYFGPMVGFRKEIAVEENLEIIPIGYGGGAVRLSLEAWLNGGPVIMAEWPMPLASIGGTHIPEPGDIIRARWDAAQPAGYLRVRASYYDASAGTWYNNIIDHTFNANAVTNNGVTVNFNDGYHKASSITIDSPSYSIRRFKAGTTATVPTN